MAWNPSPNVAEARDIATKHDEDIVIIIRISLKRESCLLVSYGKNRQLCSSAGKLLKPIEETIYRELDNQEAIKCFPAGYEL